MKARRNSMRAKMTVKTRNRAKTDGKVDEQVMRVGFAALSISSCIIGVWAAVSLVSGMIVSGGPVSLATNWFKTIVG
jgi:hypothetical protein